MSKDWTGYVVNIPDQHCLIITGPWKKERPDMWWWKCRNCFESSGVMSTSELNHLESKGMISEPDGDTEDENSRHPREESMDPYEYMYGLYGGWD